MATEKILDSTTLRTRSSVIWILEKFCKNLKRKIKELEDGILMKTQTFITDIWFNILELNE